MTGKPLSAHPIRRGQTSPSYCPMVMSGKWNLERTSPPLHYLSLKPFKIHHNYHAISQCGPLAATQRYSGFQVSVFRNPPFPDPLNYQFPIPNTPYSVFSSPSHIPYTRSNRTVLNHFSTWMFFLLHISTRVLGQTDTLTSPIWAVRKRYI